MCAATFPRSFRSFPGGWWSALRGAKKLGDVPMMGNAKGEAGFLQLASGL